MRKTAFDKTCSFGYIKIDLFKDKHYFFDLKSKLDYKFFIENMIQEWSPDPDSAK